MHRGIAWWSDGDAARIFLNSRDRLYAIDAATGEAITDFGGGGSVLLTEGHGRPVTRYGFDQTSPPVVFEDLVIVGSRVPDRLQRRFDTPGSVQAFDVRTGVRRWIFFTIPQSGDDFGADTWENESWRYTGHANVWGLMSVDTGRGLLYAPPSLQGTLQRRGSSGGANRGGAAFDPGTGLLYVRTSEAADTNQVCVNAGDDLEVDVEYSNNCPYGATLVMYREAGGPGIAQAPESRLGPIPLIKPPCARLVAIDLNEGEIAWKVPFGEGSPKLRKHPLLRGVALPERLGTRGNSGLLVTKGGLVFLGGGTPYLYAFDKATGAEVWRGATPYRTYGNPMTYRTRSGRQFIVIATGAGTDAALVAFARP